MVTKHWNRFPRGVVASPSLEVMVTQLEVILSNLLGLTLL